MVRTQAFHACNASSILAWYILAQRRSFDIYIGKRNIRLAILFHWHKIVPYLNKKIIEDYDSPSAENVSLLFN